MNTRKIAMTAIEQIQRAFETAPEHRVKEVPKVQAIRILIPQIRTMQSKGYDWEAIAALLSEQGIPVTAVTLRSYLHQARAAGSKKTNPKRKGLQEAQGSPSRASHGAVDGVGTKVIPGVRPREDKVAPVVAPKVAAVEIATESTKGLRRPSDVGAGCRSAFVPTEDSDDL